MTLAWGLERLSVQAGFNHRAFLRSAVPSVSGHANRRGAPQMSKQNCTIFQEERPEFGRDPSQVFLRAGRRMQGAKQPEALAAEPNLSRSSTPTRWTLGDRIGPASCRRPTSRPRTEGRCPATDVKRTFPETGGQGLERNLNGVNPAGDCLVRLARLLGSLRRTRQSPAPDQKPTPLPASTSRHLAADAGTVLSGSGFAAADAQESALAGGAPLRKGLQTTLTCCTLTFGDPGRTRTLNLLIRSQPLYPVELPDRMHRHSTTHSHHNMDR